MNCSKLQWFILTLIVVNFYECIISGIFSTVSDFLTINVINPNIWSIILFYNMMFNVTLCLFFKRNLSLFFPASELKPVCILIESFYSILLIGIASWLYNSSTGKVDINSINGISVSNKLFVSFVITTAYIFCCKWWRNKCSILEIEKKTNKRLEKTERLFNLLPLW